MAIYRSCVCLELNKHKSPLKCIRAVWVCRHPSVIFAGVILSGQRPTAVSSVSDSQDSKPQHCRGRSGTQVSASKTQLAASVTQFFCRVGEA